uniref:Methyltransferase n=1 Tax=viral metagenome TaxID=1070528 RepID=A0A6C0JW53_9ZZZZ
MKYCVLVIAIGDIHYKADAKEVLTHYFEKHGIPYVFLEENLSPELNYKKAHPSWLKMICHRILPGYDSIICWDLDLLPATPDTLVIQDFDLTRMCLAIDDTIRINGTEIHPSCPNFKYNCGLICIPKKYSNFTENIYDTFAPGTLQLWEQFYFNNMVFEENIDIFVLPDDINVFCGTNNFKMARLQHFTYGLYAKHLLTLHKYLYFLDVSGYNYPKMYPTRIDMINDLIVSGSTICEIGIFRGDFAKELIKLNPSRLVLLDIFEGIVDSGDQDGNNYITINLDQAYNNLKEHFSNDSRVEFMKGDSSTNLRTFPDETFDMIYIDGDHSYEGCKKDLLQAYAKIKNGGWIMGHDYEMNMVKANKAYIFGVRKAVDEFCLMHGQTIHSRAMDGCVSYAICINKA